MRRIVFALTLILAFLTVGLVSAAPAVPFKSGTTWVFQMNKMTAQGQSTVETLTVVYRGETKYRDRTYHLMETKSSLSRVVERDYLVWNGKIFRQAAEVTVDGRNTTETVFSKPYATSGVQEQMASTTLVYENGMEKNRGAYSIAVAPEGSVKITVPAGTFTATRWGGTLIMGKTKRVYTMFAVGPLEIRGDSDVYVDGKFNHRLTVVLQKGSVPK